MTQDKPDSKRHAAASAGKGRSLTRPRKRSIKLKTQRRTASAKNLIAITSTISERAGGTLWMGIPSDDSE